MVRDQLKTRVILGNATRSYSFVRFRDFSMQPGAKRPDAKGPDAKGPEARGREVLRQELFNSGAIRPRTLWPGALLLIVKLCHL